MNIGKKDVLWNYAATFLKIASSVLLLPFILKMMPAETVGIWTIFITITSFVGLLDFGFNPSFTRNVSYVYSGVRTLKSKGVSILDSENYSVDYGLLKGVIFAMRWFYLRMALISFFILITIGSYYIYSLLRDYHGSRTEVYIAWVLLCLINTYSLFTLYYDSLLQGKGLIKRSKQIIILGNVGYLIIASVLILAGYGLIAVVSAQVSSVIIIRVLSYKAFFTNDLKKSLQNAVPYKQRDILNAIYPNAVKLGLTSLGGFLVVRSATVIGSLFLTLEEIASYGITMQLIWVLAALAGIYTSTYQPKIAQLRIVNNNIAIKELYLKGQIILWATFIVGGICLLMLGQWTIQLIGSQTNLIPKIILFAALFVNLLETNHAVAGSILVTKNEVPYFKASLLSGAFTVLLLLIFFNYTNMGLWALIAAPGIAQGVYQNWKWPYEIIKELQITLKDTRDVLQTVMSSPYNWYKIHKINSD